MTIVRRLAANAFTLLSARVLSNLVALYVTLRLVRYLGEEGFGKFAVVFAFLSFFQVAAGTGIETVVIREISRDRARRDEVVGSAIVLRLVLSLGAILLAFVGSWLMGYQPDVRQFVGIASLSLLFGAHAIFGAALQADQDGFAVALPELAASLLASGAILMLLPFRPSLSLLIAIQAFTLSPLLLAYGILGRRRLGLRPVVSREPAVYVELLRGWGPIALSTIFVMVTLRIDHLLVFDQLSSGELGRYSATVRIAESLRLIPAVYLTFAFPVMCSAFVTSNDYFQKTYRLSLKYMAIAILPVAVVCSVVPERILTVLFGSSFQTDSATFSILVWAEVFAFLGSVFGNALMAAGMQRYLMFSAGMGMVLNIVLNVLLIPTMGIRGAALASLNTYGGLGIFLTYLIGPVRIYMNKYLLAIMRPLLCSLAIGVLIYLFQGYPLAVLVPGGAVVYLALLLAAHCLDREDMEYLMQILGVQSKWGAR